MRTIIRKPNSISANKPLLAGTSVNEYRRRIDWSDLLAKSIATLLVVGFLALVLGGPYLYGWYYGVGGFGPIRTKGALVEKTYVDTSHGSGSHYMVATNQGVFEVQNGWLLGVVNADEIFGSLQAGKMYQLTIKGNQRLTYQVQEYPYIIAARPK